MQPNRLIVLHPIIYTTHIDWKMHQVYRLIPFYLKHEEEATL